MKLAWCRPKKETCETSRQGFNFTWCLNIHFPNLSLSSPPFCYQDWPVRPVPPCFSSPSWDCERLLRTMMVVLSYEWVILVDKGKRMDNGRWTVSFLNVSNIFWPSVVWITRPWGRRMPHKASVVKAILGQWINEYHSTANSQVCCPPVRKT